MARNASNPADAANPQLEKTISRRLTMKRAFLLSLVLTVAGIAGAANVPTGITGLWRFQNTNNFGQATIGNDITFFNSPYGTWFLGPWTDIGIESWHTKFSDGYVFQELKYNYLAVDPGFVPNGGGAYSQSVHRGH